MTAQAATELTGASGSHIPISPVPPDLACARQLSADCVTVPRTDGVATRI